VNPQVAFPAGRRNRFRALLCQSERAGTRGEVREESDGTADGGVHALFTITGRTGANGCTLAQPNFNQELQNNNVIFRIPRRYSARA